MNTTRISIAIIAVLSILQSGLAGSQNLTLPKRSRSALPLVDPSKPAVFISFLRTGEIEPLETGVGRIYLWFRITNNTRWSIWLDMSDVPKKYGDAGLYYTIEDKEDGKIRINSRCHVCSSNALGMGRSIIFSIPGDYASEDAVLRIEYSFQWERNRESNGGSYSRHSVEYHFGYLPTSSKL